MSFNIIQDTQYIGTGGELTASEELRVQEIQALSDTASAEALGKQSGSVVKVSPGGTGGGTWGSITGTLADQADLQAALDAKANSGEGGTGDMLKSENLSGLANYTTARSNLGLGTAATTSSGDYATAGHNHSGVYAPVAQTFYIGTTQVAINRASAALTLAGITLTTPDIGTPSAGTLTNCTGLPEAGLLDNAVTLAKMAGGTDGNLITYDANGDPAYVATGDAGEVLTSNGAGAAPTFQAAAGGGMNFKSILAFTYDSTDGYTETLTGSATLGYSGGAFFDTASGATSTVFVSRNLNFQSNSDKGFLLGSPQVSFSFGLSYAQNGNTFWFGMGDLSVLTNNAMLFTRKHIGFKIIQSGGVKSLYATQADGSTENVSSALATVAAEDFIELMFKINATTSVDYYYRVNGGSWSSATNLTSNLPSTLDKYYIQVGIDNGNADIEGILVLQGSSYIR